MRRVSTRSKLVLATGVAAALGGAREAVLLLAIGASAGTDALYLGLTVPTVLMALMSIGICGPVHARLRTAQYASSESVDIVFNRLAYRFATWGAFAFAPAAAILTFLLFGLSSERPMTVVMDASLAGLGVGWSIAASLWTAVAHTKSRYWQAQMGDIGQSLLGVTGAFAATMLGEKLWIVALASSLGTGLNAGVSRRAAGFIPAGVANAIEPSGRIVLQTTMTVSSITLLGHPALIVERMLLAMLPPGVVSAVAYGRRLSSTVSTVVGGSIASIMVSRVHDEQQRVRPLRRDISIAATASLLAVVIGLGLLGALGGGLKISASVRYVSLFALLAPLMSVFTIVGRLLLGSPALRRRAVLSHLCTGPGLAVLNATMFLVARNRGATVGMLVVLVFCCNVLALVSASYIGLRRCAISPELSARAAGMSTS